MTTMSQSATVRLQCDGTAKNGKRCSYVFGETDGYFRGRCPKCHAMLTHFHQRIQVVAAKIANA